MVENQQSAIKDQKLLNLVLHRAPLVVPVASPPIADGGVLCGKGMILEVGRFTDLRGAADVVVEHEGCVVVPALINGHTHLELSHLAGLGRETGEIPVRDITAWIGALLQKREISPAGNEEIEAAVRAAKTEMQRTGTILVADIGNFPESELEPTGLEVRFLREFLGLTQPAVEEAHRRLRQLAPALVSTPHAPYSTAPELIRAIKKRGAAHGHPFSIHVAESAEELEFLMTGGGPFRTFFEQRGVWDGSFAVPASGAVEYLNRLGVLDSRTLCVHCVHLADAEIHLLATRQAKVCLCPGSNRTLGTGKPPVGKMLAAGLLPALGTDSLASNQRLDLWREMRLLREDHPEIDPEKIFAMATSGGAAAFGVDDRLGSLAPGKSARMLAVRAEVFTTAKIFDYLSTLDEKAAVKWLN